MLFELSFNMICSEKFHHWNENVIILMKVSSLAAPKVVILTTFGAASDEDFIKMKTFSFQWLTVNHHWFRWWLGAEQATSHYLNQYDFFQWLHIYMYIYISSNLNLPEVSISEVILVSIDMEHSRHYVNWSTERVAIQKARVCFKNRIHRIVQQLCLTTMKIDVKAKFNNNLL